MPYEPFIELTLNADNSVTYTLRPTSLGTNMYGIALATAADYAAKMIADEGGFKQEEVKQSIVKHFLAEIETPTNTHPITQLQ